MMQVLGAVLLAAHGLIHLIGFVVPCQIATMDGFPYRTTALGGAIALGETGARVVGVAWLVLAVGFVIAGVATWRGATWAVPLTAGLAVASLAVCALGLPEAAAGIVVNLGILAVVGWLAVSRGPAAEAIG